MSMQRHYIWFAVIAVIVAFSLYIALPAEDKGVTPDDPACQTSDTTSLLDIERNRTDVRCTENIVLDINSDGSPEFELRVTDSRGLDIVGGLRVLLQADVPADAAQTIPDFEGVLAETRNNVSRRVNGLGLTEATVQLQGNNRILVELPGIRDREQAVSTIQTTALLEFVDFTGLGSQAQSFVGRKILTDEQLSLQQTLDSLNTDDENDNAASTSDAPEEQRLVNPLTGQPFTTVITGAGLAGASAQYGASRGGLTPEWSIAFEIRPDFAQQFATFTRQAAQSQEPMALVLDGEVLSVPRVQAELSDGGTITGDFNEDEANNLALQLRSGALPIPLSVESIQEVGATLGQESVNLSVRAGVLGVIVVLLFMLVYYRIPGLSAALALLVFIVMNLALFKLIPITITLPAITGFLISIGTAVDGNILIFERIKEELREGKGLDEALGLGFERAWSSIRDSNLSTIIICGILFLFGQTPGASIVSGFALTLALGLVLNLFTAIIVTRTFLYILVHIGHDFLDRQRVWMGL